MIMLFTSEHCTWCDVVRKMVQEENAALGRTTPIYEIDIERCQHIAEVFGIIVVPTLVAGRSIISGIPCASDLQSFLFQSMSMPSISSEIVIRPINSRVKDANLHKLAAVESDFLDMHGVESSVESEEKQEEEQIDSGHSSKIS